MSDFDDYEDDFSTDYDPYAGSGYESDSFEDERFEDERFEDDRDEDFEEDEGFEEDRDEDFANEGSALRAASPTNPRNLPCLTCKEPNRLTPRDRSLGYQCDECADRAEGGGW